MSSSRRGVTVGTRRWILSYREIVIPRSVVASTVSTNPHCQDQQQCGSLNLYVSNRPFSSTPQRVRWKSNSLGANSSINVIRRSSSLMRSSYPARSHFQYLNSVSGTISRGWLPSKDISINSRNWSYSSRENIESGLPFSTSNRSTSEACQGNVDGAALLRKVATYIEEDPQVADKLGEVMGEGTGSRLLTTLEGMRYAVREPSWKELHRVAFVSGVPFVGFGMMDNAIMIIAGEYIDLTVGVAIGISTMAAAGLGNTISDVAGVGLGGFVESVATKMGLPPINLSRAQRLLRSTRTAKLIGSALGVTLGCLIGMFPLLFMPDAEVVEAVKRKEKMAGLIDAVVEEAAAFLSASSATLFILDRENDTLWARRRGQPGTPNADDVQDLKLALEDNGPVSRAARMGEAVSVRPRVNDASSAATQAVLCMPVLGADGLVAGVVQIVRKKKPDERVFDAGFTSDDAKDLSALCSHISVALENIKRTDESEEVDLRETIALMRSYGGVNQQQRLPQHRSSAHSGRRVASSLVSQPSGLSSRAARVAKAEQQNPIASRDAEEEEK